MVGVNPGRGIQPPGRTENPASARVRCHILKPPCEATIHSRTVPRSYQKRLGIQTARRVPNSSHRDPAGRNFGMRDNKLPGSRTGLGPVLTWGQTHGPAVASGDLAVVATDGGQKRSPLDVKLTAEEREVVVIYNDAEKAWHVYSDSATMRGKILRLAQQVGVEVERVGEGVEFTCPGDSLRLTAKRRLQLTPTQRSARVGRLRSSLVSRGQRSADALLTGGSGRV